MIEYDDICNKSSRIKKMKSSIPVDKSAKKDREEISDNNHIPDSLEGCRKLIDSLKARQVKLELENEKLQKAFFTREAAQFEYDRCDNEEVVVDCFYENKIKNEDRSVITDIAEHKLNEQYSTIYRNLGFVLASTITSEQALSYVIHSMLQIEGIHAAAVCLINEQTGGLELTVHEGISPEFIDSVRCCNLDHIFFSIIQKGESVYGFCNEIIENPELFVRENLLQIGVIPIKHETKFIGLVNIASRATDKLRYTSKIALEIISAQIGGTLARIESENALKLSQRNFELIFDTINDFIFILSTEGKIILANPLVERLLGYTQEELQGMSVLEVHHPGRSKEVSCIINEMSIRQSAICSVPLYKKNGEFIPVETRFVYGKWNGEDALYGVSRDTTERQKAEAELKMQSSAFDAIASAIIITDIDGNIQWANRSFSKLSGYTMAEMIGKNPNQIVKSGKQDRNFYETLWNTILNGQVWNGELINRRKDGSLFLEELTITPVMDYKGKITSFIALKIDITNRKKKEFALQRSEERWHFALEESGYGAWDWNLITNEIFFSDQWKAMLGYSVSEIEDKVYEWEKLIHPDDLKAYFDNLNKHFNGETELYMSEYRMRCKDGSYIWILDRGKIIEKTNKAKPLRIVGTHKDITNRKLLEEKLRKGIEKEKELNDLKSRFVATTSHEFRTPLASILMISDTLISYHQKMNISQLSARLIKIKNHVLYLADIVNNVLQLSKMQEGKIGFNPKNEDMISMCLNIIDGFNSGKLTKDQITFHSPFKTLIIRVDERLIIQAINNLISNAIKYSVDDFSVNIELKLIENDELILSVRDKGIGILKEDFEHLFTPFFRGKNVSLIQGNGLGLSIVRESLLLHGGKVSCSNNVDKGSTFTLHFPVDLISIYNYDQKDC